MTEPRTPIVGSPEGAEALREKLAEAEARHEAAHANWMTAERLGASHMDALEQAEAACEALRGQLADVTEELAHAKDRRNMELSSGYLLTCITVERDALKAQLAALRPSAPTEADGKS